MTEDPRYQEGLRVWYPWKEIDGSVVYGGAGVNEKYGDGYELSEGVGSRAWAWSRAFRCTRLTETRISVGQYRLTRLPAAMRSS